MNKKGINVAIIGIIIAAILVVGTLGVVMAFSDSNPDPNAPDAKFKIQCTVELSEEFVGFDVNIKSVTCESQGTCRLSAYPLGIFGKEGKVKMIVGGRTVDTEDIDTTVLTGTQTVRLSECTSAVSGLIRTVDNDGNTVDEKDWSVN